MIESLKSKGVVFTDIKQAENILKTVGYFRLSNYWKTLLNNGNWNFHELPKSEISFDDIVDCYKFDRQLRNLIFDALEYIEVSIRVAISDYMSTNFGALWFLEGKYFANEFKHDEFLSRTRSLLKEPTSEYDHSKGNYRKVPFVREYYDKYDCINGPDIPPSWIVFELLTFGKMAHLFSGLARVYKVGISMELNQSWRLLEPWLHNMAHLRNLCAHYFRLFNRNFSVSPKVPNILPKIDREEVNKKRIYRHVIAIQILLKNIPNQNFSWSTDLMDLFCDNPKIPIHSFGFPENWEKQKIWDQ